MVISDDFLLTNEYARCLYHEYAEQQPIFDFHNHLSAQEIYEDGNMSSLTEAWLLHDHYKWRAMRAMGIEERLITGDGDDYDKFLAYVRTINKAVGNPLYHWTHLELRRYFGITEPLTEENAASVYEQCNKLLADKNYSVRKLLLMQNVKALCTTDDPVDDLKYHRALKEEGFEIKVLPSFRPDMALKIDSPDFDSYLETLSKVVGFPITSVEVLLLALEKRLKYFMELGCRVSDHSLEDSFFVESNPDLAEKALQKHRSNMPLTKKEVVYFRGYVLHKLAYMYAENGIVMQLHIGALRNNNPVLMDTYGANAGCDSLHDFSFAAQLSGFLATCAKYNGLPKVILYDLNPKDHEMIATMAGNFRNVRFGPAWWFNDHKDGIMEQIRIYSRQSVLGTYIGMLTDSRSFLSFPRHEYFRRILCAYVGGLVEAGEFPFLKESLGRMIADICYQNSVDFFDLKRIGDSVE